MLLYRYCLSSLVHTCDNDREEASKVNEKRIMLIRYKYFLQTKGTKLYIFPEYRMIPTIVVKSQL